MLYATLVLLNGNFYTFNPKKPRVQAVAIFDEKIVYAGENARASSLIGPQTRVIDLFRKSVLPGFTDCHVHMASFGRSLTTLNLRKATSIPQLKAMVKDKAQHLPSETWILGGGWDQERLTEKRYPTRWDLDEAVPDHPVVLFRVCTHLCVANSVALEKTGIRRNTVAPPGGAIDRDLLTREPTGILREKAMDILLKALPEVMEEISFEACLLACQKTVEAGVTCVHWIIESPGEMRIIQKLRKEGKLPLRVYLLIPHEFLGTLEGLGLRQGFGDAELKIGGLKILLDGSLGAGTAALKEPYNDAPATRGIMIYPQGDVEKLVCTARKAGLQMCIHAIGDRAVETALDVFEKTSKRVPKSHHRDRIEHASVLSKGLIQRMQRLGIIASVQPHFLVSDFWVEKRLGKRRVRWVYPFKSLMKTGVVICGGSDCPVEPISPLLGIWAAVVRHPNPEERLTIEEAIRLYTVNAAYASFEEAVRGTIEEGKLADMVVLSRDPFKMKREKLKNIRIIMTIVGGKIKAGTPPQK